ncbi:MAG: hypothetical protein LJF04_00370 [Gemmatimonadetes bacterium]|nr:hypothetical protein [Gemmatimonadota bacterium]
MNDSKVSKVAGAAAHGAAADEVRSLRDRLEPPADQFKSAAAGRVEEVAAQIRQLGNEFDRWEEAHAIARRLERTADYLRYRPAFEVAADVRSIVERSHLLWIAGGVLAGYVGYRLIRGSGG